MQLVEREITLQAPWGKVRGLSWGSEGAPGVLLCHGKLDACSGFRPLVRLLPGCFHYVAIDLPGNGRSDPFPPGVLLTAMDFVPTLLLVKNHFKWEKFMYIGHSLGVLLGKVLDIAYPGHATRAVELDPVPAYDCYPTSPEGLRHWYKYFYHYYYEEQYRKLHGGREAPKYSYEQSLEMLMNNRSLPKEAAECVLERIIEPAGDGLYRFTFDQRMKRPTRPPFSSDAYRAIYTASHLPIFCVLAQRSIETGLFDRTPFVKDPKAWPHGNYSVKIVDGGHDVHISHPELIASDISQFLMKDVKANL